MKQVKQSKAETLRAKDIMNQHPVTVGPHDSLQTAMELMVENHVTGLAVIDGADRCMGVLSGTDILRYEQDHAEERAEVNSDLARYFDQMTRRWEDVRLTSYALEKLAELEVDDIMSRDLISVRPETPLRTVAKKMLEQEVHRVVVVGRDNRLIGLITSIDFVRLAARGTSNEKPPARRRPRSSAARK